MGSGWTNSLTEPLFSRFRVNVGTTDAAGNFISAAVGPAGSIYKVGQLFSVNGVIYTVVIANGAMLATSGAGTFNTATGAVNIAAGLANALSIVYWYPAEPVMGLTIFEQGEYNNQPSYGFDTRFAYIFTGGSWQRSGTGVTPIWHGDNSNLFWTTNWTGLLSSTPVLFVTNFQVTNLNGAVAVTDDPIWSFNQPANTWAIYTPYFAPNGGAPQTGPTVKTARIIVPFQNRLLLLNTVETDGVNNTWYPTRLRYSARTSAFAQNAWYERGQNDNGGTDPNINLSAGASFIDATTDDQIISAEFIKNRLIVFFEHSTWEVVYTGNEITPFRWQKINTELGSQSTFSSVPFDQFILTMGTTGVHSCNGQNVIRIDNKIPDIIFTFQQKNLAPERVAGIRDYYVEMVYWAYPGNDAKPYQTYPNKVLVYNYKNGSWGINDDCITAFGYFDQQPGTTWANQTQTWQEATTAWNSGPNTQQFRQIIAGNSEGFVFIIAPDENVNANNMQITNIELVGGQTILTINDHTLTDETDFIKIHDAVGVFGLNGFIFGVESLNANQVRLIDPETGGAVLFVGTYQGGGTIERVSQINMLSKQWNPYMGQGRDFHLAKIDFGVLKTPAGEVTVYYFPSASQLEMTTQGIQTGASMGNGILETRPYSPLYYPLEQVQNRLWHPIYFQTDGECIQILIFYSPLQQSTPEIVSSRFELEGLVLHTQPTRSRLE